MTIMDFLNDLSEFFEIDVTDLLQESTELFISINSKLQDDTYFNKQIYNPLENYVKNLLQAICENNNMGQIKDISFDNLTENQLLELLNSELNGVSLSQDMFNEILKNVIVEIEDEQGNDTQYNIAPVNENNLLEKDFLNEETQKNIKDYYNNFNGLRDNYSYDQQVIQDYYDNFSNFVSDFNVDIRDAESYYSNFSLRAI